MVESESRPSGGRVASGGWGGGGALSGAPGCVPGAWWDEGMTSTGSPEGAAGAPSGQPGRRRGRGAGGGPTGPTGPGYSLVRAATRSREPLAFDLAQQTVVDHD